MIRVLELFAGISIEKIISPLLKNKIITFCDGKYIINEEVIKKIGK